MLQTMGAALLLWKDNGQYMGNQTLIKSVKPKPPTGGPLSITLLEMGVSSDKGILSLPLKDLMAAEGGKLNTQMHKQLLEKNLVFT